jgi:hypothetical protein
MKGTVCGREEKAMTLIRWNGGGVQAPAGFSGVAQ